MRQILKDSPSMQPPTKRCHPIPQRILMTADTVGGVWTYALELAQALGAYGIEVALATMGAPLTEEQREEVQSIPGLKPFESGFKLEWMEAPWEDVRQAGDWLLHLEEQLRPDIVHLNGYAHGSLPWRTPTLVVAHSCVLSWWEAVKKEAAPAGWDQYRQEVTRGLRAADLVLAPSQAMLAALDRHYGPLPPGRVIPNGRDPERFGPGPKEALVLTAGRLWDEAKNVVALERVAPHIHWPICVAGEQRHPDGGTVRPDHVHPLGHLSPPAMAAWFARASIYVLPARYEPFGLSALEAGLAGCALVLGEIPSLREVWGDAALYVPPDDPRTLQAALEELITDHAYRKGMAARARCRALGYTPQRMAAAYLAVYSDLMREVARA